MKKTKKALASLAIAGMALSMSPLNVFANDTIAKDRIYGQSRIETAIEISKQGWTESDTVIVAPSANRNLVDALAAAPLAGQLDAPILLTEGNSLNSKTADQIKALGASKVYVVGAIQDSVVNEIKALAGVESVEVLKGSNRIDTAAKIGAKISDAKGTFIVGYQAEADALSVASFAAANNYRIVIADQTGAVTEDSLVTGDIYTVGGPTLVKDYAGAKDRLAGANRYETNKDVISTLEFDTNKVYVANGANNHLVDSLVASSLAAKDNAPIALTDNKTVAAADVVKEVGKVIALGGPSVVSNSVLNAFDAKNVDKGELTIKSVTATSAKTFEVEFNKTVEDASNITFEVVQDESVPVTVSVNWNEDMTVATLSKSSNFVEADYVVTVKDGENEIGSRTVTITEQKVAKIDINSDKLGVVTLTEGGEQKQYGYATYKIYDQYGADITNSALANNVDFNTGVGTITADKGLLTIEPNANLNLLTFSGGIVITAHETSSGVSTTKNLAATSQIGTLSDFSFKPVKNLEVVAGDTANVVYLDYTATDISGNETKNYELLKQGLIFVNNDPKNENYLKLTTSHPNVTAELVQDPADSKKGLIKVTVNNDPVTVDMPGVITAMTWTGKTSQVDFTLKKQAEVAKFKLFAPSEVIASGESKEIPFTAYDQNGEKITKYSDLIGKVTLTGAEFVRNVDGTASVKNHKVNVPAGQNSVNHIVTSVVTSTGNYSNLNLRIQKAVQADTLKVDDKVVKTILQQGGAVQVADLGWDEGGFSVVDQYGRDIDMTTFGKNDNYTIKVEAKNPSVVNAVVIGPDGNATGDNILRNGEYQVKFTSGNVGTGTVLFTLYNGNEDVDSKSITFTSIKNDDIKDYRVEEITKPLYALAKADATADTLTDEQKDYHAKAKVYGLTSAKADVVLAGKVVDGAVSTSDDFVVYAGANGGAYDSVRVAAKKPVDPAKTESNGYITVTVRGADGHLYPLTTPISSSTAKPAAASLDVKVKTEKPGIERDDDVITITGNYEEILGDTFAKFKLDGSKGKQNVYFAPKDQYGKTGGRMAQFSVLKGDDVTNTTAISVDKYGNITYNGVASHGDYVTVSATTSTGLVKTIKIVFNNPTRDIPPVVDKTALNTAIAEAEALLADAEEGNEPGQYPAEAIEAFQAAIDEAKAVAGNNAATQAQVDAAVNNLKAARTAFEAAKVPKPGEVNVTGVVDNTVFLGSAITFTFTGQPETAVSYVVYAADGEEPISGTVALDAVANVFPKQEVGSTVYVQLLDDSGAEIGEQIEVVLQ